jgi:2-hydroxychromene-2-carboxylate isomerase
LIRFYFDFISPYSYLASALLRRDPIEAPIDCRPVVFGTILSKLEKKGQGEIPSRRKIGLADVLLMAAHHRIPIEGPPSHPFNSLWALRSAAAVSDPKKRLELVHAYFAATWERGESLEDLEVLRRCLRQIGIDQDPEAAGTGGEERKAVRAYTSELLELGGFGVPTFVVDDLVLWGHDRLSLLRAIVRGEVKLDRAKLEEMLARPQPGRIV